MSPPRSFCIKDLVPRWCYYFIGWVNKIGWIGSRSVGISSQPSGLSASGSWLCEVTPLSSLFLSTSSASLSLSGYHDVSGSTLPPPQPQQRFSSERASQLLPDTCETMSLNKCFNFSCFSWASFYSVGTEHQDVTDFRVSPFFSRRSSAWRLFPRRGCSSQLTLLSACVDHLSKHCRAPQMLSTSGWLAQ